ncbi:DUF4153 domain-containing protein [Echinicola sp. CAU 1574]|uniref:DUF4153 domain-containing protein n=1 Tax=Echinicola arenosa TaxID=2774144 RepID=A0ABR9AJ84_9BACT|nr:DUF4153 domain-containing protein [Echinicola arenosa]MBD8487985.1 DUF4153 domain-containing protein [Echinicola arenosa]
MKLPSLSYLNDHAQKALNRFPMVILSVIVATAVGNYLVEFQDIISNPFPYINGMLTGALGISLFLCAKIFWEKKRLPKPYLYIINGLSLAFLLTIYYSLPDGKDSQSTIMPYYRFAIFSLFIHLLVSFAPYTPSKNTLGFWNYNKTLFLRFLTAALFSFVLYIGIVLAMLALHLLFEVEFQNILYLQIFIMIAGIFNTWFFIAGISENLEELDQEVSYPKGLKIFSQYILLTLLTVYLLILYGYSIKIILSWDWPKGIVSYLIICVATLGILALLLLYPYKNDKEENWINTFSKSYYYLLLPLVAILFLAIGIRINDYGVTINRYLIVLIGTWLTLVCFYFILGFRNIKIIPFTLAFMLLGVSFGPWGIFSVSERSQYRRLKALLMETHILEEETVIHEIIWDKNKLPELKSSQNQNFTPLASEEQISEIRSIVKYLEDHHGLSSMKSWFSQDMSTILIAVNEDKKDWEEVPASTLYLKTMGIPELGLNLTEPSLSLGADMNGHSISTRGYDYLKNINISAMDTTVFMAGYETYKVTMNPQKNGLAISSANHETNVDLGPMVAELSKTQEKNSTVAPSLLTYSAEQNGFKIKLEIQNIRYAQENENSIKLNYLNGTLLLKDSLPQRK